MIKYTTFIGWKILFIRYGFPSIDFIVSVEIIPKSKQPYLSKSTNLFLYAYEKL